MEEHVSEVGYTNDDDGVWLNCSCGWGQNFGFFATVEKLYETFVEHKQGGAHA